MRQAFPVVGVLITMLFSLPIAAQPSAPELQPNLNLQDTALGREILAGLEEQEVAPEQWQQRFRAFLSTTDFMEDHIPIWQAAYLRYPDRQNELVMASGLYGAEAMAAGLAAVPPKTASAWTALGWLRELAPGLEREAYDAVNAGLTRAFEGRSPDLRHLLKSNLDSNTVATRLAMQSCLVLALYGPPEDLRRWMNLPEETLAFLETTGIWLFDGDRLSEEQKACLESLLLAVPRASHNVVAILVSDQPDYAQRVDLHPPGQLITIAPVPLKKISAPMDWPIKTKRQTAPVFTLQATVALMKVVQQTQFEQRPELLARRNALIASAGNHRERYLCVDIAPGHFQDYPDALLPLTSRLWFLDTEAIFLYSLDLLHLKQSEPLNTLLLIADMLSLGGTQTPLLRIKEDGRVESVLVPVEHAKPPTTGKTLSGFSLDERWWRFALTPQGRAVAYEYFY